MPQRSNRVKWWSAGCLAVSVMACQRAPDTTAQIQAQLKSAAATSAAYAALPSDDQAWVLTQVSSLSAQGYLASADLSGYLDQLASTRAFAVDEREEPYGDDVVDGSDQASP